MHFFSKNSLMASLALYAFVIIAFSVAINFFGFKDPYLENAAAPDVTYAVAGEASLGNGVTEDLVLVEPEATPLGTVDAGIEDYVKIRTAVVAIFAIIVSLGIVINHLEKRKNETYSELDFLEDNGIFVVAV